MIDEDKQKKLIDKAKEIFGTTESCERAGYILPDGEMLDFGNPDRDYDYRFLDHSEILQVYNELPEIPKIKPNGHCFLYNLIDQWLFETGTIRMSNIKRLHLNGEMFQPNVPTKRQYETLEYCNCIIHPPEVDIEFSKCTDNGKYVPTNFLESDSEGDCVEMIDNIRKNINEWEKKT